MVAHLHHVISGSLVHRFITSGKPGKCELCPAFVEKLEAHHICYSPETTIRLCHACHHRVHFWPQRLKEEEKIELLKRRFGRKTADELVKNKKLGPDALCKLVAPSRKVYILKQKEKIAAARLADHLPAPKPEKQKLFKSQSRSKSELIKARRPDKTL